MQASGIVMFKKEGKMSILSYSKNYSKSMNNACGKKSISSDGIKLIFIVLLLASMLLIPSCGKAETKTAGAQTDEPVRITLSPWMGYAPAFIAQEKGFFEKNGVKVELIFLNDSPAAKAAYVADEADGLFEVYADALFIN